MMDLDSVIFGSDPKRVKETFLTEVGGLIESTKTQLKNLKFGMVVNRPK